MAEYIPIDVPQLDDLPDMQMQPEQGNEQAGQPPHDDGHQVRRSTRPTRQPDRFIPSFDYLMLTDCGEPSCYREARHRVRKTRDVLRAPGSEPILRRSTRARYPVDRLKYDGFTAIHYAYMVKVIQEPEPTSFEQAMGKEKWEKAMDEEMDALEANATWELVPLPKDKNAIGCKWVYKVKHNADGSVNRYKARLVVKGYAQTYGIDYEETFSPVARMATVRAVIAMAASKGWSLHQMDMQRTSQKFNLFCSIEACLLLHITIQKDRSIQNPLAQLDINAML